MGIQICPKCEINFIKDDEKYCSVCMRELRRKKAAEAEMCASCGEHPCEPGEDMCIFCLNEQVIAVEEIEVPSALSEGDDDVDMEEDVPLAEEDDIPDTELQVIHEELGMGEQVDDDYEDEDDDEEDDDWDDDRLGEHGMHVEPLDRMG